MSSFPDDTIPIVEAAERIGKDISTVRRWVRAGLIRAWLVGPIQPGRRRSLVVSLSELLSGCVEAVVPNNRAAL